jgi:hypothetical protein
MTRLGIKLILTPRKNEPVLKGNAGKRRRHSSGEKAMRRNQVAVFFFIPRPYKRRQALQIFDLALPISASQTKTYPWCLTIEATQSQSDESAKQEYYFEDYISYVQP